MKHLRFHLYMTMSTLCSCETGHLHHSSLYSNLHPWAFISVSLLSCIPFHLPYQDYSLQFMYVCVIVAVILWKQLLVSYFIQILIQCPYVWHFTLGLLEHKVYLYEFPHWVCLPAVAVLTNDKPREGLKYDSWSDLVFVMYIAKLMNLTLVIAKGQTICLIPVSTVLQL